MNKVQRAGLVLAILGALALAYGGFSYTKNTHQAQIGPVSLSVNERETVNLPVWLGGGLMVGGVLMLVLGGRGR